MAIRAVARLPPRDRGHDDRHTLVDHWRQTAFRSAAHVGHRQLRRRCANGTVDRDWYTQRDGARWVDRKRLVQNFDAIDLDGPIRSGLTTRRESRRGRDDEPCGPAESI